MSHRFVTVIFALLILVFPIKNATCQDVSMMSQADEQAGDTVYPESIFVRLLSFQDYEAGAKNDLSLCKKDAECLREAVGIVGTSCIADTCHAPDSKKSPLDCFVSHTGEKETIQGDQKALASSLCAVFTSPDDPLKRKEFLRHASSDPWIVEDELVETVAHSLALKTSGEACINYVKNYLGPYGGSSWRFRWYKVLAGCRILSKDTDHMTQERNLTIWARLGWCSNITDSELRQACEAVSGALTIEEGRFSDPKLQAGQAISRDLTVMDWYHGSIDLKTNFGP